MDPSPSATPARDDASLRWLRVLLATSVLAPALVFMASAWLDYRQTLAIANEHVDRTLRIAHEHALKVFEISDAVIGRVDDLLAARDSDALRADEPALHDRLQAIARSIPQVQSIFVLDADGRLVADARIHPGPEPPSFADRPYFTQLRAGASLTVGGVMQGRMSGNTIFSVARRRELDGHFAGVVGVSLFPAYLNDFYRELAREHPDVTLVLYREDGALITRYPDPPSDAQSLDTDSAWRRLALTGAPSGVHTLGDAGGRRALFAVRHVGSYPVYIGASLSHRVIEREWVGDALVMLGFAVAAMLALGAASLMALRAASEQHAVTRELKREAARREAAEHALRESQRMEAMGQLTGGVAHDFNNLLMVINGNLHILRKRLGASTHERQLDAIDAAVRGGVTLTRHLLAFSRRSALSPRTIDIGELMPSLCELISHSLRENIRLRWEVEAGTWPIVADPAELQLALLNIAVNARDAMPGGGTLTIIARNASVNDLLALAGEMSGEFVLIEVHDTGEGVPPAILSRVFEPFFTTKEPGKGTGLGLSQVYGFTRQSGGTVTLQSPPGKGTTVTLWLPRGSEPAPSPAPSHAPARALQGASAQGAILVVEDDAAVASVLQELLTQRGYSVTLADGAAEALERLDARRFDLLLTDVVMVGSMNGLQLARTAAARYPGLPIVVMTGYAAEISRIAAEGYTVLTKPFDLGTLARVIEGKLGVSNLDYRAYARRCP